MNKLNYSFWLLLATLVSASCFAHVDANQTKIDKTENKVGFNITLFSKTLNEHKKLQIYLPDSYDSSNKQYPVLYVFDSQRYFLHGITFQDTLVFQDKTPEAIVVGINTSGVEGQSFYTKKTTALTGFLQAELIPFINKTYRVSEERLFFGWERAAGYGLELIGKNPDLFSGYLLASPTLVFEERISAIEYQLKQQRLTDKFISFNLGAVEFWSIDSANLLNELFLEHAPYNAHWHFNILSKDDHYSTPLVTFNRGLQQYFSDYAPLRFYSIKEFNEYGGLSPLKQHYTQRGKRYGLPTEIHPDTKHYLLNQSLIENDIQSFQSLAREFAQHLKQYNYSERWINKFGRFYLKHGKHDLAYKLFSEAKTKFKQSALIECAIADSLFAIGDKHAADKHYQATIGLLSKLTANKARSLKEEISHYSPNFSQFLKNN